MSRPIIEAFPALERRLPLASLGDFPTPVESLDAVMRESSVVDVPAFVKRDDLSSPIYGGNKVRTLEVLFGDARARGCTHIFSTGAYGSNHAAATVLHARRAELRPGIVLFPQPVSVTAADNLRVVLSGADEIVSLPHWSALPFGMSAAARRITRSGGRPEVMVPGGATPLGGLGYVSAALELAQQIENRELDRPDTVVVGVGSTCTSAGLLVGFNLAARMGIGFVDRAGRPAPPMLLAVRVTPWPVTAAYRVARLAVRISRELAERAEDPSLAMGYRELRARLEIDGRFLGQGYGHPTEPGRHAIRMFAAHPLALDTTYSAKAAASVLDLARRGRDGTLLFWSTKSTVPLPAVDPAAIDRAPRLMRRWLAKLPADS